MRGSVDYRMAGVSCPSNPAFVLECGVAKVTYCLLRCRHQETSENLKCLYSNFR